MQMEIEGQEIVYKDLPDLQGKITGLLAKLTQEREAHDQEAKRLRRQEKKLRAFLGDATSQPEPAAESNARVNASGKGVADE